MRSRTWLLLPAVFLAGCAQIPQAPRELSLQPLLSESVTSTASEPAVAADWWMQANAPQLQQLIHHALRHAPGRQRVLARLDQAAAYVRGAAQARQPGGQSFAESGRHRDSTEGGQVRPILGVNHGMHRLGLSLEYEIDYLQRNAQREKAALLSWQAVRQDEQQLNNVLISSLSMAYLTWQQAYRQHALLQRQLQNTQSLLQLVRDKAANGLESRTAVYQAEARWLAAEAAAEQAAAMIDVQRQVLLALSGQSHSSVLNTPPPHELLEMPLVATENITLDQLGLRPDIVAARLRVEVGQHRVAVERAGFYPNIRLSLLAGMASSDLDRLDKQDARFGAAGISVNLPIFRSAQLQSSYLAQYAEQHQAIADYHQMVLDAIREWRSEQRLQQQAVIRQQTLLRASQSAHAAWQGATERYRHGLGSLLEVLQAEDMRITTESSALVAASEQATGRVRLIRALGGGQTVAAR